MSNINVIVPKPCRKVNRHFCFFGMIYGLFRGVRGASAESRRIVSDAIRPFSFLRVCDIL